MVRQGALGWIAVVAMVPALARAAEKPAPPPFPILLVHGIAWELEKADPVWGGLNSDDPKRPAWTGMIGYLEARGLAFGGEIQPKGGQIRLPDCLDTRGVRVDPRTARVFGVSFSPAANTDGLGYKALELAESIKQLRAFTRAEKVRLVGHSAGGLVARVYMQGLLPGVPYAGDVDRLITISAPHLGSPMAGYLGDLLGTRATSIKPDAPLIRDLNLKHDLPAQALFASIVVRGLGADERGEAPELDELVDRQLLAKLPSEYHTGGDQLIHVRSQNLRLAACAGRYERETGRPIQYVLARVPYPPVRFRSLRPYVHAMAPSNGSVQRLLWELLDDRCPLWGPSGGERLEKWIEWQARVHAEGVLESQALAAHGMSRVTEVTLDQFQCLGTQGNTRRYALAGKAFSENALVFVRNRWTYSRGTMYLTFDRFGRVVGTETEIDDRHDE